MYQQQSQRSNNPPEKKKTNKIGKPKGMTSSKPLDKTNAWSSNQYSIQVIQTLSRLGRFICFQQTGTKKQSQDQVVQNQPRRKYNQQDIPGIFLNSVQISIAKIIGEYCQVFEKSNKNCVVFFFRNNHPEFDIKEGVPELKHDVNIYREFPALQKLAPMLDQKFLSQFFVYLKNQNDLIQNRDRMDFYYFDMKNKTLKDAETILQCLFTKYLTEQQQNEEVLDKKQLEQKIEALYEQFYSLEQTRCDYETCISDLIKCMQMDEGDDQYNIQS